MQEMERQMKRFILVSFITIMTLAHAKMIDGIAVVVEGEAVTTAEISAVSKQMGISKQEATNLLIQDRLQKSSMRDIDIPTSDIDGKIDMIAKQNNLSVKKMREILKSQGTSWSKFRLSIKDSMKKEKFFQENILPTIPSPSTHELKLHYKENKESFTLPSQVKLIEYSAKSEQILNNFLQTKRVTKRVTKHIVTKSTQKLHKDILTVILQTQNGSFTRVFNAGDRYITYKVLAKTGKRAMSFEESKDVVEAKWKHTQQDETLSSYFDKQRSGATIKRVR